MAHVPEASNLSFFYLAFIQQPMHALTLTFNQQPNSYFKSGIKALPSQYLLVQCQPAMETPGQCVKYVQN